MKKLAIDLTEKERSDFYENFMAEADSRLDDAETSTPWGAPWTWGRDVCLHGVTIKDMAKNFYRLREKDIVECLDEEEEMQGNIL